MECLFFLRVSWFAAAGFPSVYVHPVSWLDRMEARVGGCGHHLVTIFHESFHGFSHLAGILGLFHFKSIPSLGLGEWLYYE